MKASSLFKLPNLKDGIYVKKTWVLPVGWDRGIEQVIRRIKSILRG